MIGMFRVTGTVFFLILSAVISAAADETIAITTYYPSPQGSYRNLQTMKQSVGDTNGDGSMNSADLPGANGQLSVARGVIFKPQSFLPGTNVTEGELVYSSTDKAFYYYNGTVWSTMGGSGGGCYVSYSGGCSAGFTNKGSAGAYGACRTPDMHGEYNEYFRPAGASCGGIAVSVGTAYICCQ